MFWVISDRVPSSIIMEILLSVALIERLECCPRGSPELTCSKKSACVNISEWAGASGFRRSGDWERGAIPVEFGHNAPIQAKSR